MNAVTKSTWERLSPLLDDYLDLPEDQRADFLARVRVDDPKLADALAGMLSHLPDMERAGFMDRPALPPTPGLAGQAVGPYTLVREIGHGGMGTVWLARRTDGRYEGEVAIKFLRSGLFGHGDAARFEREGSILARLSHPHIARLLDAGVTSEGQQPYLVLEYIDGEPIDQYCRRLALAPAARLKLFLDVLAAVAHAHNRLILHRDLKPSNILVTAAGEVKLLDFGIAKLLDDTGAASAPGAVTAVAGNAFTPEYAAPEQLQGGDVTTATDVYALGVLMYVLLGGEHPTHSPTGAPLDRMRAVIEHEPKRLSEAVLRRDGARARQTPESRRLARELRGDIDTLVAHALKKAPAERYANAADLADDVRRYLAHEPIAARPDARLYRVGKFLRRHWVGVATAGVAASALGAGGGVALWQAREAQAQRVQAEGLIEYMLGDLRKKLQPVGRLDVLDGVGAKALAYYASQDLNRMDADSLGRRARALHMIGDLAEQRGKLDEAQRDFQQAADTTAKLLQAHPNDGQRIFDQSQSEYYVGYIQWRRGHLHDAEKTFQRYAVLAERMTKIDPSNKDWEMEKSYAAQNVAIVLLDLERATEALKIASEQRAFMRRISNERPDETAEYVNSIGWVALALARLGNYEEAIETEESKISIAQSLPGSEKDRDKQYYIASGHTMISRSLLDLGRADEALRMARTSLAEHINLSLLDPSNLDWNAEEVSIRLDLATTLAAIGEAASARQEFAETIGPLERLTTSPWPKRDWRVDLYGRALSLQARLASNASETAAVTSKIKSYLIDVKKYEDEGAEVPSVGLITLGAVGLVYGDLLNAKGHSTDARSAWLVAAQRLRNAVSQGNPTAMTMQAKIDLRLDFGKEARELADRVGGTTFRHPDFAELKIDLARTRNSGESSRN